MNVAGAFDAIREEFRVKVAGDFLAHLDGDKRWDDSRFDPHNDYQRHLYGLFLRLAGVAPAAIWARLYALADDVNESQRERYCDMVLHSEIVGIPTTAGRLWRIPPQSEPSAA